MKMATSAKTLHKLMDTLGWFPKFYPLSLIGLSNHGLFLLLNLKTIWLMNFHFSKFIRTLYWTLFVT